MKDSNLIHAGGCVDGEILTQNPDKLTLTKTCWNVLRFSIEITVKKRSLPDFT